MTPQQLKDRTKHFAIEIIKLCRELPMTLDGRRCGSQLFDAATSVAAHYRAACRGRSRAEFIAKIGIVVEQADESQVWLELMVEAGTGQKSRVAWLLKEADELTAIFVASRRTATQGR